MASAHANEGRAPDGRRLRFALAIAVLTAAFELVGGLLTGSLALLADSGHVLADVGALTMALVAVWLASRPHTLRWTFGFHRAEVLAAALNSLTLFALSAVIVWHAISRLRSPSDVDAGGLIVFAAAGLAANAVQLAVLRGSQSVNVRAARLHVLSDFGGSIAAVLAGVVVALTGEPRADAALSLVIVALIVIGATRLLIETASILMASVPPGIDLEEVNATLLSVPGVLAVHDMHCWSVTTGFVAFVCHLEVAPGSDATSVVGACVRTLRERFCIEHVTIQPEAPSLHHLAATGTDLSGR